MGVNYRDIKFEKPYTMGGDNFDPDNHAFSQINNEGGVVFHGEFGGGAKLLLDGFMNKRGINPNFKDTYLQNIFNFAMKVREAESNNDPSADASVLHGPGFTGLGVYQFTKPSVGTTRRSARNVAKQYNVDINAIQNILDNMSWDPTEWNDEQADLMFLSHFMTRKGSEWYLDQIGKGNKKAELEAYFKFHHTDEGQVTGEGKERILKIFNEEGE